MPNGNRHSKSAKFYIKLKDSYKKKLIYAEI